MSILRTTLARGKKTVPLPDCAGDIVAVKGSYALTTAPDTNTKIELFPLPPGFDLVDFILISDDIDTGGSPAVTMSVGVMSGTPGVADDARTVGAEIIAAATIGQAGGVQRAALPSAFTLPDSDSPRGIGLKFPAAPATFAAGTIRFIAQLTAKQGW